MLLYVGLLNLGFVVYILMGAYRGSCVCLINLGFGGLNKVIEKKLDQKNLIEKM